MITNNKILIVDDNAANRGVLNRILTGEGYETAEAENGQQALEILQNSRTKIALVLLDLIMPVMDGYELLRKMTEAGIISYVPVIVTTGNNENNAELKSLEAGASDFIVKPYNAKLIIHRVNSMLRLFENARLLSQLETDKLTGMLTAEFFYRHAEEMMMENPDTQYEIICSNIENFRVVNIKYGKDTGDRLLKFVAEDCKKHVGEDGLCGRLSADVFAVLRKQKLMKTQEEIAKRISEAHQNSPVRNYIIQFGIYRISDRTLPVSEMCARAQLAIESIKHKFGVYCAVYDDVFRDRMIREHQLNDIKEQALREKQFNVYLQPKHDTNSGEICGAEALVRWLHPELGFISPKEFIPLFEKNGFICVLDYYVWEAVCSTLKQWKEEGRKLIPISVNASRVDFNDNNLANLICQLTKKYDIPIEMLHLEVTETAYTENPQQIIAQISQLRAMGVIIEMDDFGSGHSSLSMLAKMPVDVLKLDMKFVQTEQQTLNGKGIMNFVISLAKWMNLIVLAEGVETSEQIALLRSMDCNYVQGYYYAKPMAVTDFLRLLKSSYVAQIRNERIGGT
ncbi:MAG: EAL domain-containing response regulator, partial [Erysipelotrichia bacterium]|nr:EAL domain-containing response regulator [Erysipelotrichia bacterium]